MQEQDLGKIRPFDDVQPAELAKLYKARTLRDPAKLAALVPACNQPWKFPARHGPEAVFSFAELRHVPNAPAKLPNLTTSRSTHKSRIPGYTACVEGMNTTIDYIRRFEELNNLVPAPITLVQCFEPEEAASC